MAYVKKDMHQPGDWVVTTKKHEDWRGYFEVGTEVMVVNVNKDGYSIADKDNNIISGIGFTI